MWIPLIYLPQPCALYVSFFFIALHDTRSAHISKMGLARLSDPNERAYFWLPGSEATSTHELLDSPESDRLYIDQSEIVRVRVERDEFCDDEPGPPKAAEGVLISGQVRRVPYTITVSPQPSLCLCGTRQGDFPFDTGPVVLYRGTGSRSHSVVEGCGGRNGRRMTCFSLVLRNENAQALDFCLMFSPDRH
jgi:hypothetical protein